MEAPGLCSPSRKVVSNMINLFFMTGSVAEVVIHNTKTGFPPISAIQNKWGGRNLAPAAQQQANQQEVGTA
jgi:hypothetical protein